VIDRDIHRARALLVEGNAMLRSVAADQLRSAGVAHLVVATRPRDARLLVERESFDIIVCSREFDDGADSGQDLLDELRREGQLSHSTVFMMVTSQASYAQVMEAAESALDGILVRPYTGAMLVQRLAEARSRKRELADVLQALDAGENELALARALRRFQARAAYATWCGRVVAELLLTLRRPDDARVVFDRLAQDGSLWARLGVARALMAAGDTRAAAQAIDAVLADDPDCADAHDLQGRLLVEQCRFEDAMAAYGQAARLTPGCLLRTQHAGALAFYQGHADDALATLERAVGLGVQSKLFDALTLLLIAMLRHDKADVHGVTSMAEQLRRYQQRFAGSRRLMRLVGAADALGHLVRNSIPSALLKMRDLAAAVGQPAFDLEDANVLLMLWSRVPAALRAPAEYEALIERLALRFCTSKAVGEVLLASAGRGDLARAVIRRCQTRLTGLAEQAMDQAMQGDPGQAVRRLLDEGDRTMNARLLDLAGVIARRHEGALDDAAPLIAQVEALARRHGPPTTHIAGIQRSGRAPAGLQWRVRAGAAPAVASA
jgi:CheY-like chemotaxis protein